MAAPAFYTIASLSYPGYNLTQRGSQIVIEAENIDNPFQLWYKDDSWRFVQDQAGNAAFALINNGSKAALKADSAASSKVSLFTDYNRNKDVDYTTAWTLRQGTSEASMGIFSVALKSPLFLGTGSSPPESGDGVAVILGSSSYPSAKAYGWTLQRFAAPAYILQTNWVSQILIAKPPHTELELAYASGSFDNELGVVAVHPNNKNGVQEVWYKVPACSPLQDSNSSFFIISKMNGKALKGSTKLGDKVILTEFDPLDNNFVWSEDRTFTIGRTFLAINLANSAISKLLYWVVPLDSDYQNNAYNHPLTLREVTSVDTRSQWSFVLVTS